MNKRIPPDVYFIATLALAIFFHKAFPIVRLLPWPWNLTGILPVVAGFLITLRVNSVLVKNKTATQPFKVPGTLLTSGLFRYSRNPLYLGMVMILTGTATLMGTLSPFVFPVLFVAFIDRTVIPVEERNLEEAFGARYLDYKALTRRWI